MPIKPLQGFLLSLLTAFMWGVLPLFLQITLSTLDASTITFYRFIFAFLFVLGTSYFLQQLPNKRQFSKKIVWVLFASGLGLTINYVANVVGLALIDPESVQVIMQFAPFLLMLGGVIFFKETFSKMQILGTFVLLLGFIMFFYDNLGVLFSGMGQYTEGVLIVFLAAIAWVAYALLQKWLLHTFTAKQLTLVIYFLGALFLLPSSELSAISKLDWLTGLALLFCCVNTLIAYGAFTKAISVWQAANVSAVITLTPIFTILTMTIAISLFPDYFVASELTRLAYAGALLVVIGSMITTLGRKRQ